MSNQLGNNKIPIQITIGAIGHRELVDERNLVRRIGAAIEKVRQLVPVLPSTPISFIASSALAEGADRLIAQEVLKVTGSMLYAVIPMDKGEYKKDFKSEQSRAEFEHLLSRAARITQILPKADRIDAYEAAGREVVDTSDIIIAIWDGKASAGKGGTADIVDYARKKGCPILWINPEEAGDFTSELGQGLPTEIWQDIERYNCERIITKKLERRFEEEYGILTQHAHNAGLEVKNAEPVFSFFLRHYLYADLLAMHYQQLYYRVGTGVFILAAAAVLLAAFQVLFFSDYPRILIAEVLLLLSALFAVWLGRRRRWHTKWIDYRFLAERFRSALFIAVANLDITAPQLSRGVRLNVPPNAWILSAFYYVWNNRPRITDSHNQTLQPLKEFVQKALVEDQIRYQHGISQRCHRRERVLYYIIGIIFSLTLVAVVLHVADLFDHQYGIIMTYLAIGLPAIASSIAAIRTYREYSRNSARSSQMETELRRIAQQVPGIASYEDFARWIKEIEQIMLHENEDWRVAVGFHNLEISV